MANVRWDLHPKPLNIAHRGASGHAPENTIAAFLAAKEMGADGVELDVQLCASGEVVVVHDDDLARVSNAPLQVKDLSLGALRSIDVGSWFDPKFSSERVPTLQEVLDAIPELLVNVEIKAPLLVDFRPLCQKVAEIVKRQPKGRILVSSFHPGILFWYQKIDPETLLGYLHNTDQGPLFRSMLLADRLRPFAMHPGKSLLTEDYAARTKQKKRALNVWTLNEPEEITRAIRLGADGLIGNYPERIAACLG